MLKRREWWIGLLRCSGALPASYGNAPLDAGALPASVPALIVWVVCVLHLDCIGLAGCVVLVSARRETAVVGVARADALVRAGVVVHETRNDLFVRPGGHSSCSSVLPASCSTVLPASLSAVCPFVVFLFEREGVRVRKGGRERE